LLPVESMSRTLFFGPSSGCPKANGPLASTSDLLTVQNTGGFINANYAAREVLRILPGWNDAMATATVVARSNAPFRTLEDLQNAVPGVSETVGVAPLISLHEHNLHLDGYRHLPTPACGRQSGHWS